MYKKNIKPFFPPGSRNIILIILVTGSVVVLTGTYGIEVDFENQQFRPYLSFIFLLKFGNWKELPEIKEIAVLPLKRFVSKHSLNGNLYTEKFQIKLLGDSPDDSITISYGLYGELILEAEELSKKLNVPVREF
jgi:hypothetical protein